MHFVFVGKSNKRVWTHIPPLYKLCSAFSKVSWSGKCNPFSWSSLGQPSSSLICYRASRKISETLIFFTFFVVDIFDLRKIYIFYFSNIFFSVFYKFFFLFSYLSYCFFFFILYLLFVQKILPTKKFFFFVTHFSLYCIYLSIYTNKCQKVKHCVTWGWMGVDVCMDGWRYFERLMDFHNRSSNVYKADITCIISSRPLKKLRI